MPIAAENLSVYSATMPNRAGECGTMREHASTSDTPLAHAVHAVFWFGRWWLIGGDVATNVLGQWYRYSAGRWTVFPHPDQMR